MDLNGKYASIQLSLRFLVDLFLLISLISILSAPFTLAAEPQNSVAANDKALPTVPVAETTQDPEKAMTQALETYAFGNSTDFLMEKAPLSQSTVMENTPATTANKTPAISNANPAPITLQVLQGKVVVEKTDEMSLLVSEQCNQSGEAGEGTSSCERVYSNGHRTTVLTQNASEGDELKHQTVIEEFDGDNTLLYRKTIRHRVDYNYLNDQKAKEKEFFDIIYQPAGKKTTRELMVYEYFLDSGKAKSLAWTQYQQIGTEPKAELVYHTLLRYGNDGSPDRGLAERWDHGKKADTFMNWSRHSKGFATLDEETWTQWEGWIRNVSLQAYLP